MSPAPLSTDAPEGTRAGATDARPPLLSAREISKRYGRLQALDSVNLTAMSGEVHGLVGANGAGKSTLVRCLAGAVQPDTGAFLIEGKTVRLASPAEAQRAGVACLHQELSLVPVFTALENMSLGLLTTNRFGLAARSIAWNRARAVAADLGLEFALDRPVADLAPSQQWLVGVGRAMMRRARLLILDEPTAALSTAETEVLVRIIRRLTTDGVGIVYVSHRLDEVEELCERVTVFRDGRVVEVLPRAEVTRQRMAQAITGRRGPARTTRHRETPDPDGGTHRSIILEARNLSRGRAVRNVSLQLRAGEIVGIAGLAGSGRTELARILAGADQPDEGEINIDGRQARMRTPADALKLGISLVPEERRSQALFMSKSVEFNMDTSNPCMAAGLARFGVLNPRGRRRRAKDVAARLDLRPPDVRVPVRLLSGGNQQKVVLGRYLLGQPRVLILDEPTRGVDVGAREQIYDVLRKLAEEGLALLVIASEFEELVACARVLVMVQGRLTAELSGAAINVQDMLGAVYGVDPPDSTGSTEGAGAERDTEVIETQLTGGETNGAS